LELSATPNLSLEVTTVNTTINPEFRDLQQKVEEMRINLAKTQGEIEIIKHNSERNDRQTIKQFVIFTITMLIAVVSCLIGTSIFQTDALRREMNAKFETVNQRIDSVDKRIDSIDKRIDSIDKKMEKFEQSLEEIKKEIRSRK
jgi:peptidoglycan hydrolase CwlO-like protein